jgi:hypothetical protein
MALWMVKRKLRISYILASTAALSFLVSVTGALPPKVVETYYSHPVFPTISHIAGRFADAAPFSWFDILAPFGLALLVFMLWKRRWRFCIGLVSAAYLMFFWGWALNYQRERIDGKLSLNAATVTSEQLEEFTKTAAAELNRLWPMTSSGSIDPNTISEKAGQRIRTVIARLDGQDWKSATRIKRSRLLDPWFRVAGIEGMFNPIVHEPIVTARLMNFERPFIITHELAHVRGYPDEGDANLAALFATVSSDDPLFQYSGWFNLWLYLRTPELDALLNDGPRLDLQLFFLRQQSQEIAWVSNLQASILNLFLKANSVDEGIRSYARFVKLAVASRDKWSEYQ